MIKIAIADDHELVREGIKKLVAPNHGIDVVGEAADLAATVELLGRCSVDLLILDLCLGEPAGESALAVIRERFPAVPVLVISVHTEEHSAVRSVRAGAAGYICKAAAACEVLDAINRIARGERYINARVAELLAEDLIGPRGLSPHQQLTSREREVFVLLESGHAISKIAHLLSLSVSSVNTYRTRIFRKLQLRSNSDLVRYAVKQEMAARGEAWKE